MTQAYGSTTRAAGTLLRFRRCSCRYRAIPSIPVNRVSWPTTSGSPTEAEHVPPYDKVSH